jgi:dTDP-4-amino-4,6-dideoxygalactose transaminase
LSDLGLPDASPSIDAIPVMRPQLPSADRLLPYLRRIDATRIYSNTGPLVRELERRLAQSLRLPTDGVVCAASGTAALIGAIHAVAGRATAARPLAIVPAYTFVATASAVGACGYQAYLADIDRESWMLQPDQLAEHPECDRVGLVIPVAPFGRAVPQEPWLAFQRRTGIPVVIDGAASFEGLTDVPEQRLGELPVALSFHATKCFATGEGGAVATSDVELARRVVRALNFGFFGTRDAVSASLNGKMSEYHAAVGLAELDGWPAKRAAFRAAADYYRRLLTSVGLSERFYGPPDIAGCYALFRCAGEQEAARVQQCLARHGVDFRLWYGEGLHRHTYFADLPRDALPATEDQAPRVLGLPMASDLTEACIARIVRGLAQGVFGNE